MFLSRPSLPNREWQSGASKRRAKRSVKRVDVKHIKGI